MRPMVAGSEWVSCEEVYVTGIQQSDVQRRMEDDADAEDVTRLLLW